jgi:hypothetical protein
MGIRYISGFKGIDNAKQNLRRSTHLGSAAAGGTVLSPSQAFDPQATFVYLNGTMLREGTTGNGGDYVLTGTNTITFNTAVASTDLIEVVSYAFSNPTLPQTLREVDYAVVAADATLSATSRVTDGDYDAGTFTLTKSSHGLILGGVISVISATATSGSDTISAGRYKVGSVTSANAVVLTNMDGSVLTFANDSDSDVIYDSVFTKEVEGIANTNHTQVYLNGMFLVQNTDYFSDTRNITLDKTVNIATGHQIAIRSFGSVTPDRESEKQGTGITILDETHNRIMISTDLPTANITTTFQLQVSVRHATATNDAYRIANFFVRAEKNVPADCYIHTIADAGNIASVFQVLDEDDYSAYDDITNGNVGLGITADANGWYVYLSNRAGYSIVAGFKATAISN